MMAQMSDRPSRADARPTPASSPGAPVQVRHQDKVRGIGPGQELTFGRAPDVDLRIAVEPADLHVSRHAGTIRCLPDSVLVVNNSSRGVLRLCPPGAVPREIGPGEAITSEPDRYFELVVVGAYGRGYDLYVDARRLPAPAQAEQPAGAATVLAPPFDLTPTQRRVLAALCAPMLAAGGGAGTAATAREIGEALDRQPNYVRNVLKEIREQLTAYGVPGLVSDGPPQPGEDFRQPLARWAIRYGLARTEDAS